MSDYLALAEIETSNDPKIAALLRDWNDAKNQAQYQKMFEISEDLINTQNSGMAWVRKAESYYLLDKNNECILALDKAIEIEPNKSEIWIKRGDLLDSLNLYSESIKSYKASIELSNSAFAWSKKAIWEAKHGNKKEVLLSIANAISLNENDPSIFYDLSISYQMIGDKSKALFYIDKALENDPQNDLYWREKATILMNLDNEKALICAEKAISLNPESSNNYVVLGIALWLTKRKEEAQIAINYATNLSCSLAFTGQLLGMLGAFVESIKFLHKSLILQELPQSLVISIIGSLSKKVVIKILNSSVNRDSCLKDIQSMLEIYAQHNLLDNLSAGLVESIKAIYKPSTSDHTAQAWLEMWQKLAGNYPEFQVALNLLRVAVEYKIQKDKRVLFQLPKEERQILEELLNPNVA